MSSPLPLPSSPQPKRRSPSVSSRRSTHSLAPKPWSTLSKKSAQSSSLSLVVAQADMESLPSAMDRLPVAKKVEGPVEVEVEVEDVPVEEPAQRIETTKEWANERADEPATPGVDDVVPPLRASPPPVDIPLSQPQPQASQSHSSLGLRSSRYSLALPLLGRAKVPLEAAMRDAVNDHAAGVYEGYLPSTPFYIIYTYILTMCRSATYTQPRPALARTTRYSSAHRPA